MYFSSPENKDRRLVFAIALFCLFASLFLAYSLITAQRIPLSHPLKKNPPPELSIIPIKRANHPIRIACYGSVLADRIIQLRANNPGKILYSSDLYPGKDILPGETLFRIEKTKIEIALQEEELEIQKLDIQKREEEIQEQTLSRQMQNAEELDLILRDSLQKEDDKLSIEKTLFEKSKELFALNHISNSEFLRQKQSLHKIEQSLLQSQLAVESNEDLLSTLQLEISQLTLKKELRENTENRIKLTIKDLREDLEKTEIFVDFPAELMEVFVHEGQELSQGQELAKVRNSDKIRIKVNIPDSYFHWLYQGPLLENPQEQSVDIYLVNQRFPKRFSGGKILSVGESVELPTRSIPMIIERVNPVDKSSKIIAKEELKPGMYCKVLIELCRSKNTFYIPYEALQDKDRLYHLTLNPKTDHTELSFIENFTILHEEEEGLIVRLEDHIEHILLVPHAFPQGKEGMQVVIKKVE